MGAETGQAYRPWLDQQNIGKAGMSIFRPLDFIQLYFHEVCSVQVY